MPARKIAPVPDPEPEVEQETNPDDIFSLEHVDEELTSRLHVWGNSTQLTIQQLRGKYPEWARLIESIFQTIGLAIEEHS